MKRLIVVLFSAALACGGGGGCASVPNLGVVTAPANLFSDALDRGVLDSVAEITVWHTWAVEAPDGTVKTYSEGSSGTGFVIRSDGYIMTARHVLLPDEDMVEVMGLPAIVRVTVSLLGDNHKAVSYWVHPSMDIGIIKIETSAPLRPVTFERTPSVGDVVAAVGYPGEFAKILRAGVVSQVYPGDPCDHSGRGLLLGLAVFPGDSGGPAINTRGSVVGVIVATYMAAAYHLSVAVPSICALTAWGDYAREHNL